LELVYYPYGAPASLVSSESTITSLPTPRMAFVGPPSYLASSLHGKSRSGRSLEACGGFSRRGVFFFLRRPLLVSGICGFSPPECCVVAHPVSTQLAVILFLQARQGPLQLTASFCIIGRCIWGLFSFFVCVDSPYGNPASWIRGLRSQAGQARQWALHGRIGLVNPDRSFDW
jgi:hypothetical protein